ncbi:nicotinate-nucleotide adenylyltransferase [Agathobacter sp.]
MRTGILGGAFDPIHKGHVYMAKCAMEEYGLDRVIFVPSGHSPNKAEKNMTSFDDRYNMCRLATAGVPEFEVSDIEIRDSCTSYTYMTLLRFKEMYPSDELFFIMGGDSLDYFDCWRKPDVIADTAVILVVVRQDFPAEQMQQKIAHIKSLFPADIRLLRCNRIDVSSTQVREDIRTDKDVSGLLDEQVIGYIKSNSLYR